MTVKELRKKTGLTQKAFAAYFGISFRTLQDWEQGKRTPPDYVVSMMERILVSDGKIEHQEVSK